MGFLLIQGAFLLLPGFLLSGILRISKNRFLFVVPLSCMAYIILVSAARYWSWEVGSFLWVYGMTVLGLSGLWLLKPIRQDQMQLFAKLADDRQLVVAVLLIIGLYLVYHAIVGAYTEVPADLLRHLEFAKAQFRAIEQGNLGRSQTISQLMHQQGMFWYSLFAMSTWLSGNNLVDTVVAAMWLNTTLFLVVVFLFADRLFATMPLSTMQRRLAALLSALLVFAQMGLDVFSYVRYYSLAPGMLNFIGYFAAMVCLLNLVETSQDRVRWLLLLALMIVITSLVHQQESLFILIMTALYILWISVAYIARNHQAGIAACRAPMISLAILMAVIAAAFIYTFNSLELRQIRFGTVVTLPLALPVLGNLLILNPTHQFVMVVTTWGLMVYLLFFLNFKFLQSQPLLIAGMLSPLFTVFNPVFVDMFLRLDGSTTLWRMCFLIPLHFVAAVLVVRLAANFMQLSLPRRIGSGGAIVALLILLFPAFLTVPVNPYARATLAPVQAGNSYQLWRDLVDFLNTRKRRDRVLVDPVTGYVVSALTRHKTFRHKFFRSRIYNENPFVFDSYDDFPLDRYPGWLLIINQRDGSSSRVGARSRHWRESIMAVSGFYPENLRRHLESNPDRFTELWQNDGIRVYKINPGSQG